MSKTEPKKESAKAIVGRMLRRREISEKDLIEFIRMKRSNRFKRNNHLSVDKEE